MRGAKTSDVARSPSLPAAVRAQLMPLAGGRLTKDGVLVIRAERFRTQVQNREGARDRLAELVRLATFVPRPRIATRPTRASKERRIEAKVRRSTIKRSRRAKPELE
jgi:ribosome-associated protein